jgi:hypothetical protein
VQRTPSFRLSLKHRQVGWAESTSFHFSSIASRNYKRLPLSQPQISCPYRSDRGKSGHLVSELLYYASQVNWFTKAGKLKPVLSVLVNQKVENVLNLEAEA